MANKQQVEMQKAKTESNLGRINRRTFLSGSSVAALASVSSSSFAQISTAVDRPVITHGVQAGEVTTHSAVIWAKTDRPARMFIQYAYNPEFRQSINVAPIDVLSVTNFVGKLRLTKLLSNQTVYYRIEFANLDNLKAVSDSAVGMFKTAPTQPKNLRFAWSGDTVGQGWGIDPARGGLKTYSALLSHNLDFFINSGDTVYADNPIQESVTMADGSQWNNIITEGKLKVAETLDEFRGQWQYNLLDKNFLEFNQQVPSYYQWDDHEVVNNWSPGKNLLDDDRYTEKSISVLAARASRAFYEMTTIDYVPEEPGRVYRNIAYGPDLEIFFLDLRSYRAANSESLQEEVSLEARILGAQQLQWLKTSLKNSRATWKVIACDMPISLIVWESRVNQKIVEAVANGEPGSPKGRELEFAELLTFMAEENIHNTVWITADVHYTAAHHYDPKRAAFKNFEPFWEFVSGPLHAGGFGTRVLDGTFGPEVIFQQAPPTQNSPPSEGYQFFGLVDIDGDSKALTVRLMNCDNQELFRQELKATV